MPTVERLQMIQTVIDRKARNSRALKGWAVTLVVALLGLTVNESNVVFAVFAVSVVICFGALDARFLAIERKYRTLYLVAATVEAGGWSLVAGRLSLSDIRSVVRSPSTYPSYGLALFIAIVAGISVW